MVSSGSKLADWSALAPDNAPERGAGLTAVFMDNRSRLMMFMRARCRGGSVGTEVDDMMQELWLRCQTVDARAIGDPKSYLFRMAHNLVIDRVRQLERGRHYESDWAYVKDRLDGSADAALAERSLIARDRLRHLDARLNSVGERAALIYRQYRIEGVPQAQIAADLGVSLSTVEKDLRKAYEAVLAFREGPDEE